MGMSTVEGRGFEVTIQQHMGRAACVLPDQQPHQGGTALSRFNANPGNITTTFPATPVRKRMQSCTRGNHLTHSSEIRK